MFKNLLKSLTVIILLTSCAQQGWFEPEQKAKVLNPKLNLVKSSFRQLPGWGASSENKAFSAFLKSCDRLEKLPDQKKLISHRLGLASQHGGTGKSWKAVCRKAKNIGTEISERAARLFFEYYFVPYLVKDNTEIRGLVTGYYEPTILGSKRPTERFNIPIYKKPKDLILGDLGMFKSKWKGITLLGKLSGNKLVPYETRQLIEAGSLRGRNLELLWCENKIDVFFLHIQGSGRIVLPNGKVFRIGYAGKNGQPYTAIGRTLVEKGFLKKKEVTMDSIRKWLAMNPDKSKDIMNSNKSFVFFREIKGPGPIGAQGVVLTPGYSLAIDKRFLPLGVPIWLDTTDPLQNLKPLRRLVIAQDTGGAIKGVVRGDLFWGSGEYARRAAGEMKSLGSMFVLLPRTLGVLAK